MDVKTIVAMLCLDCFCTFTFAQIDVRRPPWITKNPKPFVFYRPSDAFLLECKAEGMPAVTYLWKKDDKDLNLALPNISRIGSDGDIRIQTTTDSNDQGLYFCVASNQYGSALSVYANVSRAFIEDDSTGSNVADITVTEGRPFVIAAARLKSAPAATYIWEIATNTRDRTPKPLLQTHDMQMAFNGDLYFAYADKDNELDGKLYKSTIYNSAIDAKSKGRYTRISVSKASEVLTDFPPSITHFSVSQTVALVGDKIEFKCFSSGKPAPTITWSGPRNALPHGRHGLKHFGTELTIYNVIESDEGNYVCTATNANGTAQQSFYIPVEAAPMFMKESDGPHNVNVTEGDSVTFNCSPSGKPLPYVLWGQNGQQLRGNAPKRFLFGSDMKSLTIKDVCRDCVNRESPTDLMVIQCAAFNVHGNKFLSGYLNVLLRTKVSLSGPTTLSVDLTKDNRFQFECTVTSDPSTPPSVQWYKVVDKGQERVISEPPFVLLLNGNLTINIGPNWFSTCDKYLGEYRCVGDNGYSQDSVIVSIRTDNVMSSALWTILLATFIGVLLLTIGILFGLFGKRCCVAKKRTTPLPATPHPNSIYDDIGYESIDELQEEVVCQGPMLPHADGTYEDVIFTGFDPTDLPSRKVTTPTEKDKSPEIRNDYMEVATTPVLILPVYTTLCSYDDLTTKN